MARGVNPETTSEDIYSACKDGDEFFCNKWSMTPEHDVNQTDEHGFTPLHYSCMYGHANLMEIFLHKGARTDLINMGGDSLLHTAAAYGKYDIVVKLLRLNLDPNLGNEHGNTALHYAAFWNYIGICEVLVKNGAIVAMSNRYGDTPLSKARPRLRKKLEGLATEFGQSLVVVPHKKSRTARKKDYMEFKQRQPEIERSQVTLGLKLGQDPYGEIWKGSWSGQTVCVKKLNRKEEQFNMDFLDSFPKEYLRLRIFSHDNILPLLAVIVEPQVHTISILVTYGSLYRVLHDLDSEVKINIEEGVKFAQDICHGVTHLHSLEPLIPRFDLNPHNIMIDEDMTAKLDMSQARFSFMENNVSYYPNWCAPEIFQHRLEDIDRRAADMYSFAIIMWEIATGKVPFAGLKPLLAGLKIAKDNARPVMPKFVNHHLQRIIEICWNADPKKRPKFEKITPILDKLEVS